MPRPRNVAPSYLPHHNGQARMCWRDAAGNRRFKTLPGKFNSPESLAAFARLSLELATSPAPKLSVTAGGPTVAEVMVAYLDHAEKYYGEVSSEMTLIRSAMRPVQELYALHPAAGFGPLELAAVREWMVRRKWTRKQINRQVGRVARAFRWAASQQLIPPTVVVALGTLAPLKAGRSEAKEAPPRLPADPEHVAKVLPFLPPHVRAVVELLRLTGARPGEILGMTWGCLDRSGDVWVYTPARHKTAYRGRVRTILFGPAARAVIVAHLNGRVPAPDEYLFSPRRQQQERFERMRAKRKTKVQPSQKDRRKAKPKRLPGETFTYHALGHAVKVACEKAGVPKFTPYMLRHLRAAELRAKFGLEHARAVLGHAGLGTTDHYARHADLKLAAEVAAAAG